MRSGIYEPLMLRHIDTVVARWTPVANFRWT